LPQDPHRTLVRMRIPRLLLLIILVVRCVAGQTAAPPPDQTRADDLLHAVHNALFSSFVPVDDTTGAGGVASFSSSVDFQGIRDAIWGASGSSPAFQRMLTPFEDLRSFPMQCGVDGYIGKAHAPSFAALTLAQREHVLFLLATCNRNGPRRLAMQAREFYVSQTYGRAQEQLAGVHLDITASAAWIAQHRPVLPRTRLRFDAERDEIVSLDRPFDYLIVGSGPAGSVLADELRKGGKHVLLVERGSFVIPGAINGRLASSLIDERTSSDGGIVIHNGMAVGGGTQVNVDLCFAPTLPAIQERIESWRRSGRIGRDEFTPAEISAAYDWVKAAIGTRQLSESEINTNNRVLWNGALAEGLHPRLYDLNTWPPGESPSPVTDKRSSESALLMGALMDPANPLSMLPDAEVRRVLFEQTAGEPQAVGVEVRIRAPYASDAVLADPNGLRIPSGTTVTIHAQTVILSAGALGSPTILLRSGLQNDPIGRGVILHPSMPILGRFSRDIDALNGTQASVYVADHLTDEGWALESMSAPPVYAALMSPGSPQHSLDMVRAFRHLAGFGVMLIDTPSPENRLTLDENGEPVIDYRLSDEDKERFREGIAEAIRVMFRGGASEVYLPTIEDVLGRPRSGEIRAVTLTDPDQADVAARNLQFTPNETILTSAHMQATDKMGSSPKDSVVGQDFHVWGTRNLYVVDGSIFPTSIGANPMQSIYTFARIFAEGRIGVQEAHE